MSEWTSNPEMYRQLSEPYPNPEEANSAMREFDDALAELRVRCRVPNMIVIAEFLALRPEDGKIGAAVVVARFGNAPEHEALVARALGRIQSERQAAIVDIMRQESLRVPR
jgi:hypothetical protein